MLYCECVPWLPAGRTQRSIRGQCSSLPVDWHTIPDLEGGFADTMCYPASYLHTFETPSFEEAALCETTAISVYAVKLVETCPSDRVAVLGSGPTDKDAAYHLEDNTLHATAAMPTLVSIAAVV